MSPASIKRFLGEGVWEIRAVLVTIFEEQKRVIEKTAAEMIYTPGPDKMAGFLPVVAVIGGKACKGDLFTGQR